MKTSACVIALLVTVVAVGGALAGEKAKADQPAKTVVPEKAKNPASPDKADPKVKKAELTGSYIKRDVHRNGQITDGMNPVLVIDSKMIQTSGASDLRQLLVHQGVNH